jgi:hypothetical protein
MKMLVDLRQELVKQLQKVLRCRLKVSLMQLRAGFSSCIKSRVAIVLFRLRKRGTHGLAKRQGKTLDRQATSNRDCFKLSTYCLVIVQVSGLEGTLLQEQARIESLLQQSRDKNNLLSTLAQVRYKVTVHFNFVSHGFGVCKIPQNRITNLMGSVP